MLKDLVGGGYWCFCYRPCLHLELHELQSVQVGVDEDSDTDDDALVDSFAIELDSCLMSHLVTVVEYRGIVLHTQCRNDQLLA